jgi:hypothetical protein
VVQVFNCSGLSASGFTATYSKKEGLEAALYFEWRGWIYFFSCAASVNFILGNSTPNDALRICVVHCFDLPCTTTFPQLSLRQNLLIFVRIYENESKEKMIVIKIIIVHLRIPEYIEHM